MSVDAEALPPNPPTSRSVFRVEIEGKVRRLEIPAGSREGLFTVLLDGIPVEVDARLFQPGILSLIVAGRAYRCVLDEGPIETAIQLAGRRSLIAIDDPRSLTARRRKASAAGGMQVIKAPMPGRIVRVLVEAGEQVAAHQGVIVIEAMKMQNELKAAQPGKVIEVRTAAGATVAAGESLLLIE